MKGLRHFLPKCVSHGTVPSDDRCRRLPIFCSGAEVANGDYKKYPPLYRRLEWVGGECFQSFASISNPVSVIRIL